jgi:hypothetical protein
LWHRCFREFRYGSVTQASCNQLILAVGQAGDTIAKANRAKFFWVSVSTSLTYERFFQAIANEWDAVEQRLRLENIRFTTKYRVKKSNNTCWNDVHEARSEQRWFLAGATYHPDSPMHGKKARDLSNGKLRPAARRHREAAAQALLSPSDCAAELCEEERLVTHYEEMFNNLEKALRECSPIAALDVRALVLNIVSNNAFMMTMSFKQAHRVDAKVANLITQTRRMTKKLIDDRSETSTSRFRKAWASRLAEEQFDVSSRGRTI